MFTVTIIAAFVFFIQLALMFGIFFTFSNSIVPGLNDVADETAVTAMRQINIKIQNPLFLLTFTTTPLFGALTGILLLTLDETNAALLVFGAAAAYLIGSFILTITVNVPLNNQLERSKSTDYPQRWADFAPKWVRFNNIRALACLISVVLSGIGLYVWGN